MNYLASGITNKCQEIYYLLFVSLQNLQNHSSSLTLVNMLLLNIYLMFITFVGVQFQGDKLLTENEIKERIVSSKKMRSHHQFFYDKYISDNAENREINSICDAERLKDTQDVSL